MCTNVYITIDTENSLGGAWRHPAFDPVPSERTIFCKIAGQDFGIGWICDELKRRGQRGVFFSEVFASRVFGENDTRRWIEYLLEQGQDVQLHTHLIYHRYAEYLETGIRPLQNDDLAAESGPQRLELLELACEIFARATGCRPAAFRAGNWRGNRALLRDLYRAGIQLDSTFNASLHGRGSFDGEAVGYNRAQRIEGVWELPVTVARQNFPNPGAPEKLKPLTPTSLSFQELKCALDRAFEIQMPHAVVVLHSFSGVKAKDVQYSSLRPDRIVRRRFSKLLDYLAENPRKFHVSTFGDLAAELGSTHREGVTFVPDLGIVNPFLRKCVQAMNSIYYV